MKATCGRLFALTVAGVAVLAGASSSLADYEIIVESAAISGGSVVITQGGPLDQSTDPTQINVNTGVLNLLLMGSGYTFSGLTATSNQLTGSGIDTATLTIGGTILRDTSGGAPPITIIATDTDYNFPVGTAGVMGSSASDAYTNITSGTRTFQSYYDPSNMTGGTTVPSPLSSFTFIPSQGSDNNTAALTALMLTTPYALTNTTVISMGASTSPSNSATDVFGGTTTVQSVPEPASFALVAIGMPLLAFRAIRQRRKLTAKIG